MNEHLVDNPNVVEMILLDHNQEEHDVSTQQAWQTLESKFNVINDQNSRPTWKDPTPKGNRAIIFGTTLIKDRRYDGCILWDGIHVAAFRLGKLDGD